MCAGQRSCLRRESRARSRRPQRVADGVLPQFLDEFPVPVTAVARNLDAEPVGDRPQMFGASCRGDLFTEGLRQRRIHFHRRPFAVEIVDSAIGQWHVAGADRLVGDFLNNFAGDDGGIVVGAVGLICLEHREFRRMRGIRTFVSEHPIQLENLLETADEATLEEQLRRDPQVQVGIERIGVGDERPRGRAAGQRLQHRRLDLKEAAPLQRRTHRAYHRDPLAGDGAGLRTHDEIDIALPHAGFFAHLLVRHGKRPQRLGNDLPGIGEHREFAAAGADHLAVHENDVTEVDVGLPRVE